MNSIETMLQRLSTEVWLLDAAHFNALLHRSVTALNADRRERDAQEKHHRAEHKPAEEKAAEQKLKPWAQREKDLAPVITDQGIAVIRVEGATAPRLDQFTKWWYGMSDTHEITGWVNSAAMDTRVNGILIDINSPGGSVLGAPELGAAVVAARDRKPVMVYTDMLMASGGYYTAAGASAIYSSASAIVGSIGVYMMLYDWTGFLDQLGIKAELFKAGKFKAAGAIGTQLSDAQRENFQAGVDRSMAAFRAHVTGSRKVANEHMEGQTFDGAQAATIGLVDSIATRERAMADLLELASMYRSARK